MCSFSDAKLFIIEMCPTEENSGMLMSSVCIEVVPDRRKFVYRRESNLALLSSPVTKNNVYIFSKAYCYCMKHEKISSSAPGLGLMTHREYRVDRPFPVM